MNFFGLSGVSWQIEGVIYWLLWTYYGPCY